ncbi:unnamed protein product [Sphagnum troendelagicum]
MNNDKVNSMIFSFYLDVFTFCGLRTSGTSSIQLQKTLMRSLIQASPVLGGLLTAASLSDKFHLIKVEKAHISGNFHQETSLGIALFPQAHRIWMFQECQSFPLVPELALHERFVKL